MKPQHVVEITEGVRVNSGGLGRIACHIAQYPAADMGVIAGDDKSAEDADPSDPREVLAAEIVKYADDIGLTCPAQREFCEHHGCAEKDYNDKVNQQETSSSALICSSREFPDVAETNSGPCRREYETDFAAPLGSSFFHKSSSFFRFVHGIRSRPVDTLWIWPGSGSQNRNDDIILPSTRDFQLIMNSFSVRYSHKELEKCICRMEK